MMREAKKKADQLGILNRSITGGRGNIAGYLAEIALNKHLESEHLSCAEGEDKYNFDLLKKKKKIEVKCKRRTCDPQPEYEVSIAATSKHQQPDFYAFISITFREKRGKGRAATYHGVESIWLCGFISREEFFEKARFVPKGKIDKTNWFKAHANMYNLPIQDLHDTIRD